MNKPKTYWDTLIDCKNSDVELLSYYLFENGATGVEEITSTAGRRTLKAFFEMTETPQSRIEAAIQEGAPQSKVLEISQKEIENWQENWKDNFKPLQIGRQFVIRPPWEQSFPEKKEIIIMPGQGFGTGYHESTRLAIDNIEHLYNTQPPASLIDVGTGSGILCIAGMLLGTKNVTAIDIEQESVDEVPKNMELSNLSPVNAVIEKKEPHLLEGTADLVIANIISEVLISIASDLVRLTQKKGYIILSGILITELDNVLAAFPESVTLERKKQEGDWVSLLLKNT